MDKKFNEIAKYNQTEGLISRFIKDSELRMIFRKAEKVVTALYMITNFFSQDEPLKWEIRKTATKILRRTMSFTDVSVGQREAVSLHLRAGLFELASLFKLAYNSGFVSQMNFEIVSAEIDNLAQQALSYTEDFNLAGKLMFEEDYFQVKKDEDYKTENGVKDIKDRVIFTGHRSDLDVFFKKHLNGQYQNGHKLKDNPVSETRKDPLIRNNNESANTLHSQRRNLILEKVKSMGPVTIKDIASQFSDLSEKTIQRELLKMVEDRLVQKEGERRWTKYFIS